MREGPLLIERTKNENNGIETLRLKGPLTLATLFEFQAATKLDPTAKLIIDLGGVPYVDSAGLGAVLSFHAACRRTNRKYALVGMTPRVYTMFSASKVDRLVQLCPSVGEAETYLNS
jgi:anti-sigma B factor antagonist